MSEDMKEKFKPVHRKNLGEVPPEVKEKMEEFIKNQKPLPQEFQDIINDNFWDLI